jgi:hypothetical protein
MTWEDGLLMCIASDKNELEDERAMMRGFGRILHLLGSLERHMRTAQYLLRHGACDEVSHLFSCVIECRSQLKYLLRNV